MKKFAVGLIALVLILAVRAQAEEAAAQASAQAGQVSETTGSTVLGIPTERMALTVSSTYHGPSVGSPSWHSVDRGKKSSSMGQFFDTDITPAYMVSKDFGVGIEFPFMFIPVKGGDFILGDIGAKFFNKSLIRVGNFNATGSLYIQPPTSEDAQKRGMDLGVKGTSTLSYTIPGSRWRIGSRAEAKWYAGSENGRTFKLFAAPGVTYRFLPTLAAQVQYEMEARHNVGDTGYFNFTAQQTNLQPGLVWNVTPKILVNPFVQLFTGNTVTLDTTAAGLYINASVL
jgi:hypothetical protein